MITLFLTALAVLCVAPSSAPLFPQGKPPRSPWEFFPNDPEIELVTRYLESRHIPIGGYMSLTIVFTFADPTDTTALLNGYQRLFGVNLRLRGPDGGVVLPFARVSAEGAGMRISDALRKAWACDSMLARAVRQAVADGEVRNSDRVVACTYLLRPWLTAKYRRTELLQGDLVVKRNGQPVKTVLRYENGQTATR